MPEIVKIASVGQPVGIRLYQQGTPCIGLSCMSQFGTGQDSASRNSNTSYLRANYPGRDGQDQDDSAISSGCRTGHRQTPQTLSAFSHCGKVNSIVLSPHIDRSDSIHTRTNFHTAEAFLLLHSDFDRCVKVMRKVHKTHHVSLSLFNCSVIPNRGHDVPEHPNKAG